MKKGYLFLIIVLIAVLVGVFMLERHFKKEEENYDFEIYFFNAGKADAILLSKDNKYIMIDTGEEDLSNTILNYFKNNNITKLDYLIITHFDKDHVGSASKIIDNIEIGEVLESNYPKDSIYYNNYRTSLANKNIEAKVISGNYEISLSDVKLIINGPETTYDKNESNNSSLIVSATYKNNKFLFMGDAENQRIKDFLETNTEKYDFIKVPYHGHYLKRFENILENNTFKYAVITSSSEELEDSRTIDSLNKYNVKYYLTRLGNIRVLSDGENIIVKQ